MGRLKSNLFYNMTYQVLILFVPFVTMPYISRVLGPNGVGTYSVTTAIAKYFWIFALLGMNNYGNRAIAKVRDDKKLLSVTFWNLVYFQTIISTICTTLYIVFSLTIGKESYGIVALCQLPYVLSSIFEIGWFFFGLEEFKFIVVRNAIVKIATMFAIFAFVKDQNDLYLYVLINSLSLLFGQLCLWPFIKKKVFFEYPRWSLIINHFKPNLILFVSVVAVSIYTLMDKIMIELLSTTVQVGYYENTEKIMNMCCSVVGAVGAVMLPRISFLMEKKDNDNVKIYLEKSMKYIMTLAIALSFGIAGVAKEFSIIFFGLEFAACGQLIVAISPAIIFYSWENILRTQYLLPGNRDKIFVMGTVYAAATNMVLNLLLIPLIGAVGAVLGTVGAQVAASTYQSVKIRREVPLMKYVVSLLPTIFVGTVMFSYCRVVGFILGNSVASIIMQVSGGIFTYAIGMILVFFVQKDELVFTIIRKFTKSKCEDITKLG